jgi:hypothetical protein
MELYACRVSPSLGCGGRAGPGRCGREALPVPLARVRDCGDMLLDCEVTGYACVIVL